jgi:hypothetical protein
MNARLLCALFALPAWSRCTPSLDLNPGTFACYSNADCRDASVASDAGVGQLDAPSADAVSGDTVDGGSPDAAPDSGLALVWRNRSPRSGTTPPGAACFGFDPRRKVSVLASDGLATFEWNGFVWTAVEFTANCPSPVPMLYDDQRSDLIQPGPSTQIYSVVTGSWTQWPTPGPPVGGAAVGQSSQKRFIYHGGYRTTTSSETWALDDELMHFVLVASNGPRRAGHSLAYDAGHDQIILFGGTDGTALCDGGGSLYCGSTWLLDEQGWRQLHPQLAPSPRNLAPMIYDQAHQRIILFGGQNEHGYLGDTWAWDGTDWTDISNPQSPPTRCCASLTYDPQRDQVVLFGGSFAGTNYTDTWELGP